MNDRVFVLFFDAKMLTIVNRREYQRFLKELKGNGYGILQKSVYIKNALNDARVVNEERRIREFTPSSIEIRLLLLSRNVFDSMININCDQIRLAPNYSIISF